MGAGAVIAVLGHFARVREHVRRQQRGQNDRIVDPAGDEQTQLGQRDPAAIALRLARERRTPSSGHRLQRLGEIDRGETRAQRSDQQEIAQTPPPGGGARVAQAVGIEVGAEVGVMQAVGEPGARIGQPAEMVQHARGEQAQAARSMRQMMGEVMDQPDVLAERDGREREHQHGMAESDRQRPGDRRHDHEENRDHRADVQPRQRVLVA